MKTSGCLPSLLQFHAQATPPAKIGLSVTSGLIAQLATALGGHRSNDTGPLLGLSRLSAGREAKDLISWLPAPDAIGYNSAAAIGAGMLFIGPHPRGELDLADKRLLVTLGGLALFLFATILSSGIPTFDALRAPRTPKIAHRV